VTGAAVHLVRFGELLRTEGVDVDTTRLLAFSHAASELDDDALYWAGRFTLLASQQQIPTYDDAFRRYFGGLSYASPAAAIPEISLAASDDASDIGPQQGSPGQAGSMRASRHELLRQKLFSPVDAGEQALVAECIERLRSKPPSRASRRTRVSLRGSYDLQRSLRAARRTAGEPLTLFRKSKRRSPRRGMLLLDVSGSMTEFSRPMLLLGYSLVEAGLPWRLVCFGTRVTDVTTVLRDGDIDRALSRIAGTVTDFDGGTRISASLEHVMRKRELRAHLRGSITVIHSDGLEVGGARPLAVQMANLRRLANRVIWCNPYQAVPGFEPTAGGMRAALPFVDQLTGDDVADLVNLLARDESSSRLAVGAVSLPR
jgi:uncharacterized protein with von Willebrand factor type A (vWA) domain